MDAIVVSHNTALDAIRRTRRIYSCLPWEQLSATDQKRLLSTTRPNISAIDTNRLERFALYRNDEGSELDLLVGTQVNRRSNKLCNCHLLSKRLPASSILKVADGVYCCSPELTALQYSQNSSLAETVMLLLEFLGTYSLPASDASEQAQACFGCEAVCSLASLRSMAKWATSSNAATFRAAVNLVTEGSASPMESLVYAMLGLPMRHGGFGCSNLPKGGMLLNHRIDFDATARQMSSQMPYAICDCYIPSAKIDLEYNGLYHEQQNARIHDGNRNNGLKAMGITVLVINKEQAQDLQALEAMAQLIHKAAGKRFRYQQNGYRSRQNNLLWGLRRAIGLN